MAVSLPQVESVRHLQPRDRRQVVVHLAEHPAYNAFLLGQIARGALSSEAIAGVILGYFRGEVLAGVMCCGSNLVMSHGTVPEAITHFALFARQSPYVIRVIIGEDNVVDQFMEAHGRHPEAIALERSGQILFELHKGSMVFTGDEPRLRAAAVEELAPVMDLDRGMIGEELGIDPFKGEQRLYREGWLRRIRELRAWVIGPHGGPLQFKVEQSAVSDQVIQISGVYTVPTMRRQGLATAALGEMCRHLFQDVPLVTLYVDGANARAVSLYKRLGFRDVGRIRTVWFRTWC
jgi:predicted GNAT family acetyltransferase